jgi:hypothetical protein
LPSDRTLNDFGEEWRQSSFFHQPIIRVYEDGHDSTQSALRDDRTVGTMRR